MEPIIKVQFKVNLHSLVSESRYLRLQEQKFRNKPEVRYNLRQHRTGKVREEIRITNLAYAYAKNMPYSKVESKTNNPLTGEQIHRIQLKLKRKGVESINVKEWLTT